MANIFRAKSLISRTGVFSNEVLSPNLIYNTGDQNISGIKSFYSRPTVNGTGVLLSGEAANLPNTIVYTTGNQIISGNKTLSANINLAAAQVILGSSIYFEQPNDSATQIIDKIDTDLQLARNANGALFNPLYEASWNGSGPSNTEWNNDGWSNLSNVTSRTYYDLYSVWGGGQIGANIVGSELVLHDTANDKYYKIDFSNWQQGGAVGYAGFAYTRELIFTTNGTIITGDAKFNNNILFSNDAYFSSRPTVNGTGVLLVGEAGQVPDTVVQTSGTQTISGNKTFTTTTTFTAPTTFSNNITVSQTGIFGSMDVSVDEMSISGLNLILTSGTGIFNNDIDLNNSRVLNASNLAYLTGLQSTGLILNNSIISLSGLFTGFTGNLDATYATDTQLFNTGSTLQTNINNLSNTYATINNLASTGSTLDIKIGSLSGTLTSTYATITNLALTGSTLISSINSLNNNFTGFTGNLDSTYATDTQLFNTGSTLDIKINSLSGSLNSSGINLNNRINLLSGVSVLSYGDQNITGNKTFINNIEVQETGIFNALDLSNISDFSFSGVTINLIDSIVQSSGQIYISGNPVLTGVDLSSYATNYTLNSSIDSLSGSLNSSGIILTNSINSLSGSLNSSGLNLSNSIDSLSGSLNSSGINLNNSIISLSGLFTGYTGNLDATYATDIQLLNTGITLNNSINSLSGTLTSTYATINNLANTGSTLATDLASTGLNLDTKINTLSGSSVLLYGNQTISGLKDFTTRPTVNTTPVLLSGEATDGLHVFVKNDDSVTLRKGQPVYINGANGVNILVKRSDYIGDNTSSKTLGLLAQDLAPNDQGFVITEGDLHDVDTSLAGSAGDAIWLGPTGSVIYGLVNKPYAPNHLVYLGVVERKHANVGKIYVKVQNGFELEELHNVNIDHKNVLNDNDIIRYNSASGIWFNETLNTGTFQTQINSLSGTLTSEYATITNLSLTGSTLTNNLASTGSTLQTNINNLSGYINSSSSNIVFTTGDQAISGNKTFIDNISVSGTGIFNAIDLDNIDNLSLSGVDVTLTNSNVNVAGNIFISGNPVLTGVNLTPYATTVNLALTGLNLSNNINSLSGLFTGYTGNLDSTFASDTQLTNTGITLVNSISSLSGTLTNDYLTTSSASSTYATITNLALTGSTLQTNINNLSNTYATITNVGLTGVTLNSSINSLSGLFTGYTGTLDATYATDIQLLNTGITLNNNITSLSGLFTGFTGNLDASYATDLQVTNTGITLNTRINNLSGYINSTSSNIVFTTGNQIISGVKTFVQDTTFGDTGQGDFLVISGNNFTVYGSGNFTSGLFVSGSPVLTGSSTLYATTANLALTGSTLQTNINNLSNTYATITNVALTGSTLATNIASTGSTLQTNINNLSNTYATITNLALTGSTLATNLASTGSTLQTNINNLSNTYATITNVALTGSTLVNNITSLSGLFTGYTGTLDATYATDVQVLNTGITLNTRINNLSGYINSTGSNIVFTTGNQNIGGNKTFTGVITFSGQEVNLVDTALNLSGLGDMTFSGTNINFINSPVFISGTNLRVSGDVLANNLNNLVYSTGDQTISGNKTFDVFPIVSGNRLITGVDLSSYLTSSTASSTYSTITNLASTGSTLVGSINSLSGTLTSTYATITNLASTGSTLDTKITNLSGVSVLRFGDQTISGVKTFIGNHIISGDTIITGHLSATSKSFLIDHPTQTNKKLQYGSLESPYHGIRLTDKNKISADIVKVYLPEYISSLVNDEKINIQLTNINHDKILFIKEVNINENNFTVGMNRGWFDKNEYEFYWSFTAERKDIPKLTVEF